MSIVTDLNPLGNGPAAEQASHLVRAELHELIRAAEIAVAESGETLNDALAAVASTFLKTAVGNVARAESEAFRKLVRQVVSSGRRTQSIVSQEVLAGYAQSGAKGLLAAMLLTPAWRWSTAPRFEEVADELWGDYSFWLFTAPAAFSASGEADAYASHLATHAEDLARWTERNLGSPCVRAALDAYLTVVSHSASRISSINPRLGAVSRGRILSRSHTRGEQPYQPALEPAAYRRLKVGFVGRTFGSDNEGRTLLAHGEQLDAERFDVVFASHSEVAPTFADQCQQRSQTHQGLTGDLAADLATLRDLQLDVVVYHGDTLARNEAFTTQLALRRVAPLQVALGQEFTTGLPTLDLYVLPRTRGEANLAARFSERLGELPLSAGVFAPLTHPAADGLLTRETVGLPADAVIFVATASDVIPSSETRDVWARVLAAVPQSLLIVQLLNEGGRVCASADVTEAFAANFAAHDVALDRLAVSDAKPIDEIVAILRLGDVYLSPLQDADARWIVEAARVALPIVAAKESSALGTLDVISAAIPEIAATAGAEAYVTRAVHLSADADLRTRVRAELRRLSESTPLFLDTLAASDAFGFFLENAVAEAEQVGVASFRKDRAPLRPLSDSAELIAQLEAATRAINEGDFAARDLCLAALKTDPASTAARVLYGRALLASGNAARAVTYLIAAVQQNPDDAVAWYSLAQALRTNSQPAEAIQALETCLRIDQSYTDAWLMLAELAESAGALDIAREALEVLQALAPTNPDVSALAARLATV